MAPVWMSIALDDGGFGSPAMRERCEAFERTVEEMLTASRAGQLDGNEIGRGEWRLMLVGKSERRLREIAAEAVAAAPDLPIAIEPPPPRAKTAIRRGMVFRIPVAGGWAYAQFVGHDPQDEMGDMLIVFDQVTADPCAVEQIDTSRIMFGPVFAAWRYLVQDGTWPTIGTLPVPPIPFPSFRYRGGWFPDRPRDWFIWDGYFSLNVGPTLTPELERLERRMTHAPHMLIDRINWRGEDHSRGDVP